MKVMSSILHPTPPSYPGGQQRTNKDGKKAAQIPAQLYNLAEDVGETKNLVAQYPEKVKELEALLETIRTIPYSRR